MADNNSSNIVQKFESKVNNMGAVAGVLTDNGDKAYDLGNLRMVAVAYGILGAVIGSKVARKNAAEGRPAVGGLLF